MTHNSTVFKISTIQLKRKPLHFNPHVNVYFILLAIWGRFDFANAGPYSIHRANEQFLRYCI